MKKFRIIFFIIYGAFHIGLMGVALYADSIYPSEFTKLIDLGEKIPIAKWLAAFGCLLFLLNAGIFLLMVRSHNVKVKTLEKDRNLYKAKMYDMQEALNTKTESDKASVEKAESEDPK